MPQQVKVRINVDLEKAGQSKITDDVKLYAAKDMHRLMTPYVPMDTGMLMQTVDISKRGVHYKVPWARRQYNGVNFRHNRDKHPLATAEWAKAMMTAQGDKLLRDIQRFIAKKGE